MIAALLAVGILVSGPAAGGAAELSQARTVVSKTGSAATQEGVRLALMRYQPHQVRVFGDFGAGEIAGPWAATDGLHYDRIQRPGPLVSIEAGTDPAGLPSPIPWSSLTEIQARGNAARRGTMIGLYAGTLAAIIYASTAGFDTSSDGRFGPDRDVLIVMSVPLAGGLAGALIGATMPTWKTIYRAGELER